MEIFKILADILESSQPEDGERALRKTPLKTVIAYDFPVVLPTFRESLKAKDRCKEPKKMERASSVH